MMEMKNSTQETFEKNGNLSQPLKNIEIFS